MWIDNDFVPVTLVQLVPQEIVRYKTQEKDGYVSAVVGVEKKELKKDKGQKISYKKMQEYKVDDSFDYLLRMPIYSITAEKISEIESELENLKKNLNELENKTQKKMWLEDLN